MTVSGNPRRQRAVRQVCAEPDQTPKPGNPRPRIIQVAAGLVFRDGRLLIAQRHPGSHLGGFWEFPGGKREKSERFSACLARELMEELGIQVFVEREVERLTHAYPGKTVHLRFFLCRWLANEPRALGCHAFRWVRPEELRAYSFPAADARLLGRLLRNRKWWTPGGSDEGPAKGRLT